MPSRFIVLTIHREGKFLACLFPVSQVLRVEPFTHHSYEQLKTKIIRPGKLSAEYVVESPYEVGRKLKNAGVITEDILMDLKREE